MARKTAETLVCDWADCYGESWKDVIVPEAFAHPAKMSYALLRRILNHGLDMGYWKPGDVIGDPFGGIGTTGLLGAYAGLQVVSVELEPKFVALAEENYAKHRPRWEKLVAPVPRIIQGDSRKFAEIIAAAGVVTSPPYAASLDHAPGNKCFDGQNTARHCGQIHVENGCGEMPGNIALLAAGSIAATVTSPPFEQALSGGGISKAMRGEGNYTLTTRLPTNCYQPAEQGLSEGQIANETGETYWAAMKTVYIQVHEALRPGGVAAIVIKDYVRDKARVPLCDQTCQLLTHLGFTVFQRCRAWLVKVTKHNDLFDGEQTKTKERKSFFRRLAEKKGSPRIDFEEVIWCRKNGGGQRWG